jgi:UDP-galactopyranose mutase
MRASSSRAMSRPLLIVGAGFAGAVHARTLADDGHRVTVIDRRPHLAGNAFDEVDANGVRIHRYGPHLFHTNSSTVIGWIRRFARWLPYRHRVRAELPDGRRVPLPINLDTLSAVFGQRLQDADDANALLARLAVPIAEPRNAGEYLRSRIGDVLTDLFFRPYTRKMWAMELEQLDASVVRRIPLRVDREDAYFPGDRFQALPAGGYAGMFGRILDHPRIAVHLATPYANGMERDHAHCFNSMAIDEWFGYRFGELPYRSIRFEHRTVGAVPAQDWSVTNFTDDGRHTRETAWHVLPGHRVEETGRTTLTREEPCAARDNGRERYYPVKTADGAPLAAYRRYREAARGIANMTFIGRCGTYQYLDMDQVISQSLARARRWSRTR